MNGDNLEDALHVFVFTTNFKLYLFHPVVLLVMKFPIPSVRCPIRRCIHRGMGTSATDNSLSSKNSSTQ